MKADSTFRSIRRIVGRSREGEAVLLAMAVVALASANPLSTDTIKLSPSGISVQSSPSLPPEVQALEAQTAPALFDRSTLTQHTAYNSSHVTAQLEAATEVRDIRVFGAAPYAMSVQAEVNGSFQPMAGLQNLNLATRTDIWNTFSASTPITTARLRFDLAPASGSAASGLKAIEIWGKGARVNVKDGLALLNALRGATPPAQGRLYIGSPQQGVIGGVNDDLTDNRFSVTLDRDPEDFKRLYLAYDVLGISHWANAIRAINDNAPQGGFAMPPATDWSTQVETIHPGWLKRGMNTVSFSVPAGYAGTYTVRNVYLVAELESGANFVAAVSANQLEDGNPSKAVLDGDLVSGWTPYPSGNVRADTPTLTFTFDKPTQLDGVSLYLVNSLKGSVNVEFLKNGAWNPSGAAATDGRKLATGWNGITAPSGTPVDSARLVFSGGQGSSAEVKEVAVVGSGVGPTWAPRFTVSYPDAGQYFGRTAYLRGFLQPPANASGAAQLFIANNPVASSDGAFGVTLTKDDVGLTSQGDSEAWSVEVKGVYPDGTTVTTLVQLNNYQPAVESTDANLLPTYNFALAPGQAKKISYDAATLDLPADALTVETTIGITPLKDENLATLDTGMANVTKGPRKGYRFTPHLMKFQNKIKVTLPYHQALIPPGLTEQDIKTFYFDDQAGSWKELERVAIDTQANTVTSLTDHFTDMINATVTVPDHPQTANFNPTQIKDIKAADPGAQVNLIEPPRANNQGDARLSYPIDVPPGRQGMQPQLAVQYNSSGGNGWMGLGWDLPLQAITIDTRWGVPRYDADLETETYTLSGEQLTPVTHRGDLVTRTPEKIFHTRIEGQFRRIIRRGTLPNNYTWEVTDKNGVKYLYGATDPASETLTDAAGNIFLWALCEIRDPNGNFVRYHYAKVNDTGVAGGAVPGSNVYLQQITYAGSGAAEGPYAVTFLRDRDLTEPRRVDVQIDARGGFKRVSADLLRRVDVSLSNQLIRRYEFGYQLGAFEKTLLSSITQKGAGGVDFPGNTHTFTYFDEVRTGSDYSGFESPAAWTTYNDNVRPDRYFSQMGHASDINGQFGTSSGLHLYIGVGVQKSKSESSGDKKGIGTAVSTGALDLVDVDGDGLPDKVFRSGDGFFYRKNLGGPSGSQAFSSEVINLPTLPGILREKTNTQTFAAEHHGGSVSPTRLDTVTINDTVESMYMTDANGDGLTDVVVNGVVHYGYIDAQGRPAYTLDSTLTPAPVAGGAMNMDWLPPEVIAEHERQLDEFHLVDSIRRWTAPFDGTVRIGGTVQLVQDTSPARAEYATADGVRVAIQQENVELWVQDIAADNYNVISPTGVDQVVVSRGDRLYFRVQSKFDGAFDQVRWDPEIAYVNAPTDVRDVNNLDPYRYRASADFTLAGRPSGMVTPANGTVQLTGVFSKLGVTTDDIEVRVLKNGVLIAPAELFTRDSVRSAPIESAISVQAGDTIELNVKIDSPVDLQQIHWNPRLVYTAIEGETNVTNPETGEPILALKTTYAVDTYSVDTLSAPQATWVAPQTGTVFIKPSFDIGNPFSSAELTFTAKRRGALLAKRTTLLEQGVWNSPPAIPIAVTQGDKLYFDFSLRDSSVDLSVVSASAGFTYSDPATDPPFTPVPTAVRRAGAVGALPIPYRGWTVAAYNGNRDRANQPIVQGDLGTIGNFDENTGPGFADTGTGFVRAQKSYPMLPVPKDDRGEWDGPAEQIWVRDTTVSASRLGPAFPELPSAGAGGPQQVATNRVSRSRQRAQSISFSIPGFPFSLGGSQTVNDPLATPREPFSESLVDYVDLNGDRFPDIVTRGSAQFTTPIGGLEPSARGLANASNIRGSKFFAQDFGTTASVATGGSPGGDGVIGNIIKGVQSHHGVGPTTSGGNATAGGSGSANNGSNENAGSTGEGSGNEMPAFGFNVDLLRGKGDSEVRFNLIDMNGDGLPDRVTQDDGFKVSINLGYGFAAPEIWGEAPIAKNESRSSSVGGGVSFNQSSYGFGGGLTFGKTRSFMTQGLLDVNGDGLPDRITITEGGLLVGINTGSGFAPDRMWGGVPYRSDGDELAMGGGKSGSAGLGVFFSYAFELCNCNGFKLYLIVNPGAYTNAALSRQEATLKDIDGDGLPDQLISSAEGSLSVQRNRTGRTNLLRQVSRPLGGRITLAYDRSGNTADHPQSRWVMSRVELHDGQPGDGVDTQLTTYRYANGRYDRREREFLGYRSVTEEHRNIANAEALYRTVSREYLTDGYYTKGLLKRELTADVLAHPFLETENTYVLRNVDTGTEPADGASVTATIFPMLARMDRRFYEGGAAPLKVTHSTNAYDSVGNISRFFDAGDVGAADDVEALIGYSTADSTCVTNYIVGKATAIDVLGAGRLMRRRLATVDCTTGNVGEVRQLLENGQAAVTNLAYFANGNLLTVTGPANKNGQRYALSYEYDPTVATYVTRIADSFGLFSTADYDLRYGNPTATADINNQRTAYAYDEVGRVTAITGPYEQGSGLATIRFGYHPEAPVPYALTSHVDKDAAGALKDPIETLLFTDGLKRVIQTKKDAAVDANAIGAAQDVMIVSGRLTFDFVGRAIEQFYPVTEGKGGANTVFNPSIDTIAPTRMEYDILDRNTRTTIPDGTFTTIAYGFGADRQGLTQFQTTVTDANNRVKQTYRDVRELIASVKEFDQSNTLWTSYAYDPLKQIVKVLDDRSNTTTIAYDNLGRRTAIDNPDTGKTETVYDMASNVTKKITATLRATGQAVEYDYDFNRLSAIRYPLNAANNVSYTYGAMGAPNNSAGRISRLTDAGGIEERTYGPLGEIVKTTRTLTAAANGSSPPPVYTTLYRYDTWNRLLTLTYPDGELLTYGYDSGGNVTRAQGKKGNFTYDYLNRLTYDKFEARAQLEAGNGITTRYAYEARTRRLASLQSGQGAGLGNSFQNLAYGYDNVGNILSLANAVPVPNNGYGGPATQRFTYDALYRLSEASGNFQSANRLHAYTLTLAYDTLHNVTAKQQSATLDGRVDLKTSYLFPYAYESPHPHAPTHIGGRSYTYDANGNQTGFTDDATGARRTLTWDEDNRLGSLADQGNTVRFIYDHQGQRLIKANDRGLTSYVNAFYTAGNGQATKHVFAGATRLASKLEKNNDGSGPQSPNGQGPIEKDQYFFHPDHLGSTAFVTDRQGKLYEHIEYFPFGETWVQQVTNAQTIPYLFTGKELDQETGLYYFGARYYDPRTSVWQSADPILGKYLPTGNRERDQRLSGMGGVYSSFNLGLYSYSHLNPVKYTDPDGKETQVLVTKDYLIEFKVPFTDYKVKLGQYGSHAAVRVDNPQGQPTLYDPAGSYNPIDPEQGGPVRGSGDFFEGRTADLESYVKYQQSLGSDVEILRFATTPEQEKEIAKRIEAGGGAAPCFCAKETSSTISGVGPFKELQPTMRPGKLSEELKDIKPQPKVELREAPQQ